MVAEIISGLASQVMVAPYERGSVKAIPSMQECHCGCFERSTLIFQRMVQELFYKNCG